MNTTYKNKKGFTLIEILLVVAVITILAGVAFYNIHVSIADFKERAEMLSIRNGSYGFFEPGAQFETEQRLNFRNYISEMRSLSGDPSVGVLPENADEEGVNPVEGGDEGTPGGGGEEVTPGGGGDEGTPAEEGGGEGTPAEEGGGGDEGGGDEGGSSGAPFSNRVSSLFTTGNRMSFSISNGGADTLALSITRNGDNYVMSGCTGDKQWILQGNNGAPAMPGFSWGTASYTLNDAQIAWLANSYGIDVTALGGGGGGGTTEASTVTEPSTGGGSGGAVSWGATVGNGGNPNGTCGVLSASTSGNVTTFYMTQCHGWDPGTVTITDNGNGTYTIDLGSRGMSDSFINYGCPGINWGQTSFVLTQQQKDFLNNQYGIQVP